MITKVYVHLYNFIFNTLHCMNILFTNCFNKYLVKLRHKYKGKVIFIQIVNIQLMHQKHVKIMLI
jgi:hypothetical protein